MMQLCAECLKEYYSWLDYKLPTTIRLTNSGSVNSRSINDIQEARFQEWRRTIQTQQRLIRENCEGNHD